MMFRPNGVTPMTTALPMPKMRPDGHGRLPRGASVPEPEHIDRVPYGLFRNDYLYITEACQLRCEHRRLKHAVSPYITICSGRRRVGRGRDGKLDRRRTATVSSRRHVPGPCCSTSAAVSRARRETN